MFIEKLQGPAPGQATPSGVGGVTMMTGARLRAQSFCEMMHRALGVGAAAHRNVVVRAVRRKNVEPAGVPAEPPAPAKTRKAKAVKPAAEVADGQVSAPARKPRGSKKVEATEEAAPGAMATGSSATAARAKSISASNLPWANAAARPAAAPAVRPRRERREKAAPMAQRLQEELEAVEASITRIGADG